MEINKILGFEFYFVKEVKDELAEDNKEIIETKIDMLISELIDFNIGQKIRKLQDIDLRAKKEKSLF